MANFFLTHRAMHDLLEIESWSTEVFGVLRTRKYMKDLYKSFNKIAENPSIGHLRQRRSLPFLMAPTGQHFAIYQSVKGTIIIVTILHGRRDIEAIIDRLAPVLAKEMTHLIHQWDQ